MDGNVNRYLGILMTTLLLAGLWACELDPDVGPLQRARCSNEDSDPDNTMSYTRDIETIWIRSVSGCGAGCHDPGSDSPIGVTVGGLDLTSYEQLLRGGARSSGNIVVPGKPCESILYLKLTPTPPFGNTMPAGGSPLSLEDRQLVHDWIAEGARDN